MRSQNKLIYLLYIAVFMLALFHLLRFSQSPELAGYDQYFHVKVINGFDTNDVTFPLDILLKQSEHPLFWMRFLPLLAAIVNVLLISLLIKKLELDESILLFVVLSPVFLYLHTSYNVLLASFSCILLATYALLNNRFLIALLLFLLSFYLAPQLFVVVFLLLLVFFNKKIIFPGIIITAGFFAYITRAGFVGFSLETIRYLISDISLDWGLSSFTIILGMIGLAISWRSKENYVTAYFLLGAFAFISFFSKFMLVFVDLAFAYFAAIGFTTIRKRKWEAAVLKNYVVLLIICGLLLSSLSYMRKTSEAGPFEDEHHSLSFLETLPEGKVLSHPKFGFYIQAISGKEVYIDKKYLDTSLDKERLNASLDVFASRDLKIIRNFLETEQIRYVWINPEMKQGLVWQKEDEGIQLLLKNSQMFKRRYLHEGIEIYEYVSS